MRGLTMDGAACARAKVRRVMLLAASAALFGLLAAGLARAEINSRESDLRSVNQQAVFDLLGAERSRFASLMNRPKLASADPARPGPGIDDRRSRAALDALNGQDADTAAAITEARSRILPEMMATDSRGAIDLSEILSVEIGERSSEWRCLTEALYFEARGENLFGQVAVAEVILNRVDSKEFPRTVCGVVRQGTGELNRCQFSFFCDGKPEDIANRKKFEEMGKIAWVMLHGKPRILTGNATHYHTSSVAPRWAKRLVRTARIGAHIFYRPPLQLSER